MFRGCTLVFLNWNQLFIIGGSYQNTFSTYFVESNTLVNLLVTIDCSLHLVLVIKQVKLFMYMDVSHSVMKVNIFFRPEEAMLGNWQKFVFDLKNFLFLEILEPSWTLKKSCLCFNKFNDTNKDKVKIIWVI